MIKLSIAVQHRHTVKCSHHVEDVLDMVQTLVSQVATNPGQPQHRSLPLIQRDAT